MDNPCVHLVDDDVIVRRALASLLSTVGINTTEYPDGSAFLSTLGSRTRGCILLDVRMPGIGGMGVLEQIAQHPHHPPVVMLSGHGNIRISVRALRAGAFDFLEKPIDDQLLIDTVQTAMTADAENERRRLLFSDMADRVGHLSPRERQVMDRIVEGKMNKQIASDLNVCVNTVEVHRASLMRKLRVRSVAELVRIALTLERWSAGCDESARKVATALNQRWKNDAALAEAKGVTRCTA